MKAVSSFILAFLIGSGAFAADSKEIPQAEPVLTAAKPQFFGQEYSLDCNKWEKFEEFSTADKNAKSPRYFYSRVDDGRKKRDGKPLLTRVQVDRTNSSLAHENMLGVKQFAKNTYSGFLVLNSKLQLELSILDSKSFDAADAILASFLKRPQDAAYLIPNGADGADFVYMITPVEPNSQSKTLKYSMFVCKKEGCYFAEDMKANVPSGLTTTPIKFDTQEFLELKHHPSFNKNLKSDLNEMCSPQKRSHFLKLLESHREMYHKNCKAILDADNLNRNWVNLCDSYRKNIRPRLDEILK